ncbi:unnamed protein product, partial [Polarella glacialis]
MEDGARYDSLSRLDARSATAQDFEDAEVSGRPFLIADFAGREFLSWWSSEVVRRHGSEAVYFVEGCGVTGRRVLMEGSLEVFANECGKLSDRKRYAYLQSDLLSEKDQELVGLLWQNLPGLLPTGSRDLFRLWPQKLAPAALSLTVTGAGARTQLQREGLEAPQWHLCMSGRLRLKLLPDDRLDSEHQSSLKPFKEPFGVFDEAGRPLVDVCEHLRSDVDLFAAELVGHSPATYLDSFGPDLQRWPEAARLPRALEVLLLPGELLVIPGGWWVQTYYDEATWAANSQYLTQKSLDRVLGVVLAHAKVSPEDIFGYHCVPPEEKVDLALARALGSRGLGPGRELLSRLRRLDATGRSRTEEAVQAEVVERETLSGEKAAARRWLLEVGAALNAVCADAAVSVACSRRDAVLALVLRARPLAPKNTNAACAFATQWTTSTWPAQLLARAPQGLRACPEMTGAEMQQKEAEIALLYLSTLILLGVIEQGLLVQQMHDAQKQDITWTQLVEWLGFRPPSGNPNSASDASSKVSPGVSFAGGSSHKASVQALEQARLQRAFGSRFVHPTRLVSTGLAQHRDRSSPASDISAKPEMSPLIFLPLALLAAAASVASADQSCDASVGSCPAGQEDEQVNLLQHGLASTREVFQHEKWLPFPPVGAGNPAMDDVKAALSKLSDRGSPMALFKNPGVFPARGYDQHAAPYSTHFQGVQRLRPGSGSSTYFVLTGASHEAAHLFVAKVASRAAGEGALIGSPEAAGFSQPDQVVSVTEVETTHTHAGGPAIWGDFLAVGAESGCSFGQRLTNKCPTDSAVWFFDMSDPEHPKKLPYHIDRAAGTAGAVGLMQQKDGTFLLMVGRGDSAIIDFYVSKGTDLSVDPEFGDIVATWKKEELLVDPGLSSKFESYQNLNMVMQADGTLFFIGTSRYPLLVGDDLFDLYTLKLEGGRAEIKKVASKKTKCVGCDFYAGAGIYVDSPTSMLAYGTDWNPGYDGQITVNEFTQAPADAVRGMCQTRELANVFCYKVGDLAKYGKPTESKSCSATRGPTTCENLKCTCKMGYCAVNGHCVQACTVTYKFQTHSGKRSPTDISIRLWMRLSTATRCREMYEKRIDSQAQTHQGDQAELAKRVRSLEESVGLKAGKLKACQEGLLEKVRVPDSRAQVRDSLQKDVQMWKAQFELAAKMKADVEREFAHFRQESLGKELREKQEQHEELLAKQEELKDKKATLEEEALRLDREIQAREANVAQRTKSVADLRQEVLSEVERAKASLAEAESSLASRKAEASAAQQQMIERRDALEQELERLTADAEAEKRELERKIQVERAGAESLREAFERLRTEQRDSYKAAVEGPSQQIFAVEASISEIQQTADHELAGLRQRSEKLSLRSEELEGELSRLQAKLSHTELE